MTTTNTKSRLPEQEPDRRTTLVLCDGEMFISVGARKEDCWESISKAPMSWIKLCDFAASCDRATLVDLADLPTGLTEVQKGAIRSAVEYSSGGDFDPLMSAFPEVSSDDLEIAKRESGKGTDDLIRVASMDGARMHNTDWTVTVTAPKPVNRTGVDPVVLAGQRGTERSKQLKRVGANIYRDQESWARFSKPTDARDADALRRAFLGR